MTRLKIESISCSRSVDELDVRKAESFLDVLMVFKSKEKHELYFSTISIRMVSRK